jgi:hypothetical protein
METPELRAARAKQLLAESVAPQEDSLRSAVDAEKD